MRGLLPPAALTGLLEAPIFRTKLTAAATVAAAGLVLVQIGRYWWH